MAFAPYTSNPVSDAARYYDALDAEAQAIERESVRVANEISIVLITQIRTATNLTLPHIRGNKVVDMPVRDVISDEIGYGKPFEVLMRVLQSSDCPHVACLRMAIAQSYINSNASEIAEISL